MKKIDDLPTELKREGAMDSPDGIYNIPHPYIREYLFHIIFSTGSGWEHLSVTLTKLVTRESKRQLKSIERCPTWIEMSFLKDMFWEVTECVVQFHPPMADHISNHPYCLHLWRSIDKEFPAPDSLLVGLKNEVLNEILVAIKEIAPGHSYERYMTALYYSDISQFKVDKQKYLELIEANLLTL